MKKRVEKSRGREAPSSALMSKIALLYILYALFFVIERVMKKHKETFFHCIYLFYDFKC